MALTDLLLRGSSAAVVVFVVSSTLRVSASSLTVGQILARLKNARLVVLSLAANFVVAPLVALGLWRVLGLDEPLGIGLLLCGLAAGAPFSDRARGVRQGRPGLRGGPDGAADGRHRGLPAPRSAVLPRGISRSTR